MDITVYITDLLAQNGTLVVPGLGTFFRSRTEGYYNKEKQLFFPPSVQIHFKPETTEDDALAQYLAKQRSISAASARYFIEKYVTGLKYQATLKNVEFGGLGFFGVRRNQLVFTSNQKSESDELFYGLAPVKLIRNNSFRQQVVTPKPEPVKETPPAVIQPELQFEPEKPVTVADALAANLANKETATPIVKQELVVEDEEQEDEEEQDIERRKTSPWLVFSFIIIFIGLCLIVAYTFKPALFDRFLYFNTPKPQKVQKPKVDTLADSTDLQKDTVVKPLDTAKTIATVPAVNNIAQPDTFGIVVATLKTYAKASLGTKPYIKQGLPASVHKQPGKERYQVTIATCFNLDSAKAKRGVLMQQLKLQPQDISVQKYPYKKQ